MYKNSKSQVINSPLGKLSAYIAEYDKTLLYPILRKIKRDEIQVPTPLPFYGFDTWNAYEISWLNLNGKPEVAIGRFDISSDSENIIESKSFKLYLNSFNNSKFLSIQQVQENLKNDIQNAVNGNVYINLVAINDFPNIHIANFDGECIDGVDVTCDTYIVNPQYLACDNTNPVEEVLFSHLLKSNCLVTGQPDWGTVKIHYKGAKINRNGLLKYIVSFRNHNEFHEQCVERIFMDIMRFCKPEKLTVEARYTRRGGLDINPVRSTEIINPSQNIRMARQ